MDLKSNLSATNPNESMVYAFGSNMTTRIKIGTSINVDGRLVQIQGMCPFPLSVLWRTHGDHRLEDALHKRFGARRVHGEWFDFAGAEDPVAEIAAASAIEAARLAAVEANWFPVGRPDWRPEISIIQVRGAVLVMPPPSEGGWRCVALSEKRGRRCPRMMDDRALFELPSEWAHWVVPGLGVVEGRSFEFDGSTSTRWSPQDLAQMRAALLSQVCSGHLNHEAMLLSAWRPFDLRLDFESIARWDHASGVAGVMPGLELLDEYVQDYVFGELSVSSLLSSPAEVYDPEPGNASDDLVVPRLPPTPLRESLHRNMAESYLRALGPYVAMRHGAKADIATVSGDERMMLGVFAGSEYALEVSCAINESLPQPGGDDYRDRRRYVAYCGRWTELSKVVLTLASRGYLRVVKSEAWFPGDPDQYEITSTGRAALAGGGR